MILRKPYAFFIKIFKPLHLIMSMMICYLIFLTNKILVFFNSYIYSNVNVVDSSIKDELIKNAFFIIPIMLIVFSLIFLGIMFKKNKPVAFYVVNIFFLLAILVINAYTSSFLSMMEAATQSIKIVKLCHDLILINMVIEVILFVVLIIRGFGLNFEKFNFGSDISRLSVNENDKEEFELNINVDFDTTKRNRKRIRRHIKYIYKENKFIFIICSAVLITLIIGIFCFIYFDKSNIKTEGNVYTIKNFNILINKSHFINKSFNGEKITDDYLVVAEISLKTNQKDVSLFLKDFSLEVGEAILPVSRNYSKNLVDIGLFYDESPLTSEFSKYILVFELPAKYTESELFLVYNNVDSNTKIKLEPQVSSLDDNTINKRISETIYFKESLGDVMFTVNSFEIANKFLIKYNYCFEKNECVVSKEYITPSINENFDKVIMKLNVDYKINEKNTDLNTFFKFFNTYGIIKYKKNDIWYTQVNSFEELKSKKVDNKNNVYIGVNSNVLNAESIKLIFNVRNFNYEYILK